MTAEPQKEHLWLQRLAGEWAYDAEVIMAPDQPPVKHSGSETVRTLGGIWILAEGHGDMPGCGPATTLMTLGYDPDKGRFVGTFIGSMMTQMWLYNGSLDASGNVLVLDTEGPSMDEEGKTAKYQDLIEFKSDDHRTISSQILGEDGQWRRFMTASYRRKN